MIRFLRSYWVPWIAWIWLALILFGPVLFSSKGFAFRDSAHYYPPLLKTVHEQWAFGMPLWNPNEERGRPLWADPTAGVLYPGQLIFALPLSFDLSYKLFIVGHVLLAATTCFVAARRIGLSNVAASLSSVAYAFGHAIVFQYCNLPYLIGAAWLPLGVSSVLRIVKGPSLGPIIELALVMTLMVFGGDPETAYLLGVTSLLAVACAVLHDCDPMNQPAFASTRTARIAVRLLAAGVTALGLSAAQWLPTAEWAALSERAVTTRPVDGAAHTAQTLPSRRHEDVRYQFSIGPWRWMELGWPNVSGRQFPRNERWITAIPAEGRVWSPSLYLGVLPLLLAIGAMRFRSGNVAVRWLSCLVIFGLLGSLGRYGLGWFVAEAGYVFGRSVAIDSASGGLYWCLVKLLPGFELFRYPAKLWLWTALGLSLLAGIRLDDATRRSEPLIPKGWMIAYLGCSLMGIAFCIGGRRVLTTWWSMAPSDPLFGPLQIETAHRALLASLVHGATIGTIGLLLIGRGQAGPFAELERNRTAQDRRQARLCWTVLTLTVIELSISGRWMIASVDTTALLQPPGYTAAEKLPQTHGKLVFRLPQTSWYPAVWSRDSSVTRIRDGMIWDRWTARPKYPIDSGDRVLRSSTSFSSREHRALLDLLDEIHRERPEDLTEVMRQLGVDYVCVPSGVRLAHAEALSLPDGLPWRSEADWYQISSPNPLAWLVHRADDVQRSNFDDPRDLLNELRAIFFSKGRPRDFRYEVILDERPEYDLPTTYASPVSNLADESCSVSCEGPDVTIQATLRDSGWLVVNQSYLPGWRATVRSESRSREVPILRANGVMQAVHLPAGQHHVNLRYEPRSVRQGIGVSLASGGILLAMSWWLIRRSKRLRKAGVANTTSD